MIAKTGAHWLSHVALIGGFPPPIGGNSVHIARMYRLLKANGHDVKVLDYTGKHSPDDPADVTRLSGGVWSKGWQVLKFMWSIHRDSIVHFHVSALARFRWFAPGLLLASFGHKRVITVHSGSFRPELWTPLQKLYIRMLLSQFNVVIAVSQEIRDALLSLGIDSGRIRVIPAYIREKADLRALPETFAAIPHDKIKIVTSGYLTRLYNYGILAEIIKHLDQEKFHFIFAFYNQYDQGYERELLDLFNGYSNITIYRDLSPEAFLAVLDSSDVYVRTALRDGDSVAVREALALGKDVYATDCVRRPTGCVVFRSAQELRDYLQSRLVDQQAQQSRTSDGTQQILESYAALSRESKHATNPSKP